VPIKRPLLRLLVSNKLKMHLGKVFVSLGAFMLVALASPDSRGSGFGLGSGSGIGSSHGHGSHGHGSPGDGGPHGSDGGNPDPIKCQDPPLRKEWYISLCLFYLEGTDSLLGGN
jgi:hypothetical protein